MEEFKEKRMLKAFIFEGGTMLSNDGTTISYTAADKFNSWLQSINYPITILEFKYQVSKGINSICVLIEKPAE